MPLSVPYIPNYFAIDDFVTFIVSALLAIMVNAEGQAFTAMALGYKASDTKDRFHFNAFLHLDLWGSICFALAGFGWPKKVKLDAQNFSMPRLYLIISRFGGPFANFLLASIAGSIVWIMTKYGAHDRVFTMVIIVNVSVAAYNILPIAPLAGSGIISALFSSDDNKFLKFYNISGPFILLGIFIIERFYKLDIVSNYIKPIITALFDFIMNG